MYYNEPVHIFVKIIMKPLIGWGEGVAKIKALITKMYLVM